VPHEIKICRYGMLLTLLFVLLVSACGVADSSNPTRRPTSTLSISIITPETHLPPTATDTFSATAETTSTVAPNRISTNNIALLSLHRTLTGNEADVTDVALSADGTLLVSGSQDGTLRVWLTADGELMQELTGHSDAVHSVDISADGSMVISGSDDRTAALWRVADGMLIHSIHSELLGRVLRVAFSPDGYLFAAGGHRCIVELRSTRSGILRRTLAQPFCSVTGEGQVDYWGLAFNADGSQIVTGEGRPCCGGSLQLWQVEESVAPALIRGYDLVIRDVAISPDGETLAVALVGSPFFWLLDMARNEPQRILEGHRLRVNDLEFSPDGDLIASASRDGRIALWDVESGELLRFLEGDGRVVTSLDFATSGQLLASGLEDGTIMLWGISQ
jgi:WD40 repeat protein